MTEEKNAEHAPQSPQEEHKARIGEWHGNRLSLRPSFQGLLDRINSLPENTYSPNDKMTLANLALRGKVEPSFEGEVQYAAEMNKYTGQLYARRIALDHFGNMPSGLPDEELIKAYQAMDNYGRETFHKLTSPKEERKDQYHDLLERLKKLKLYESGQEAEDGQEEE
ncbi:MAG: hypothetical protein AAB840_02110 [Patescibacteria group bacterium]